MKTLNLIIKRIIDFLGSLIGVIIISPILIITAILIKITSKGPVIFKQERLGKDGKVFNILKFRTMVVNAEKLGDGIFVKTEQDNRITKIGKILRVTSLDELPQLWNVIIGDMSLVGPRPPVTYHPYKYDQYSKHQKLRFNFKPGITGYAQVSGRNKLSWEERIEKDIWYVNKFSIILDIKILLMTTISIIPFKNKELYLSKEAEVKNRQLKKQEQEH